MTILSGDNIHASLDIATLTRKTHRGRVVFGWFPDTVRTTMQMLLDRYDVRTVIEVGSYVGLSACFFAERVDDVVCVDHFDRTISPHVADLMETDLTDHYALFLKNTEAYPNIRSIKAMSLEAAKQDDLVADLVFIDAGHEYDEVKADVEAWTPHALKVVCGDDNHDQHPGVQRYAREIGADVSERIWWLPIG